MGEIIVKKIFDFGKIDYYGRGRKINSVAIKVELTKCGGDETFKIVNGKKIYTGKKTPEYIKFTASGEVWNGTRTQMLFWGQNLDELYNFLSDSKNFCTIYDWWKKYHLNEMHAGTLEQEKAIEEHFSKNNLSYSYNMAKNFLNEKNMLSVPYYGKSVAKMYNGELYQYGTDWLVRDIPATVLHNMYIFLTE